MKKTSYKKLSFIFNKIIKESATFTLIDDLLRHATGIVGIEKAHYTNKGTEAIVKFQDGKKYKITVELIK